MQLEGKNGYPCAFLSTWLSSQAPFPTASPFPKDKSVLRDGRKAKADLQQEDTSL